MIKPQSEFPLMERYKAKFPIDHNTIFAYNGDIYTNSKLTDDLLVHENVHLEQQKRLGLEYWVENFLNSDEFRLEMEMEAYKKQVDSIWDTSKRQKLCIQCAQNLSSGLYGDIISLSEAFDILIKKHG